MDRAVSIHSELDSENNLCIYSRYRQATYSGEGGVSIQLPTVKPSFVLVGEFSLVLSPSPVSWSTVREDGIPDVVTGLPLI